MAGFAVAEQISIDAQPEKFVIAKGVDQKPDTKGFVLSREVVLPAFEAGANYRPFSGGGPRGNRVEAVAFKSIFELQAYKPSQTWKGHTNVQQGQFILLKLSDEEYFALLPMLSPDVYGQFFVEQSELLLLNSFKSSSFANSTSWLIGNPIVINFG